MVEDFKKGFLKTLWILREYSNEIIIGGGWAPLVYYHYLIKDKSKESIRTRDIDLFIKTDLPILSGKTVDQLLEESGLKANFKSFTIPPVVHYEGCLDGNDVEVEFLTDQKGAKKDSVIEVQKGLHATALRFVSIILENTIVVDIDDLYIDNKSFPLKIKVPSPQAYVFHKGLIYNRRLKKTKGAKDIYYIFDLLESYADREEKIMEGLIKFKETYPKWFEKFLKNMRNSFSELHGEGVLMVLKQRPSNIFPDLNDAQFKQYVFGRFQRFLNLITA
jgi:hypothetical protein